MVSLTLQTLGWAFPSLDTDSSCICISNMDKMTCVVS
jgi:hypothetical protein